MLIRNKKGVISVLLHLSRSPKMENLLLRLDTNVNYFRFMFSSKTPKPYSNR